MNDSLPLQGDFPDPSPTQNDVFDFICVNLGWDFKHSASETTGRSTEFGTSEDPPLFVTPQPVVQVWQKNLQFKEKTEGKVITWVLLKS